MSNMKIILLKDVKGIGKSFEEKNVSDGHALNLLLPKGFAVVADNAGRTKVEQIQKQREAKHLAEERVQAEKEAKRREKHEALEKFKESQKQS